MYWNYRPWSAFLKLLNESNLNLIFDKSVFYSKMTNNKAQKWICIAFRKAFLNAIHERIHLRSVIPVCIIRTDFYVVLILTSLAFTLRLFKPGNQKPKRKNPSMVGK